MFKKKRQNDEWEGFWTSFCSISVTWFIARWALKQPVITDPQLQSRKIMKVKHNKSLHEKEVINGKKKSRVNER